MNGCWRGVSSFPEASWKRKNIESHLRVFSEKGYDRQRLSRRGYCLSKARMNHTVF